MKKVLFVIQDSSNQLMTLSHEVPDFESKTLRAALSRDGISPDEVYETFAIEGELTLLDDNILD